MLPSAMIAGLRLPTLEGTRVRLRWLEPADVGALYGVFSNSEVMRYWCWPAYEREEQARELLAQIERAFREKSLFQWGIALRADDHVIGTCTLAHVDASNLRAELGYALARDHWRCGLMGEALALLLAFAFGELHLRRLEADVDPRNAASIRSLERLGFRREGYLRERWCVNGEIQDALFYGLLRREWEERAQGARD
jgi:RimJ/RimL family protein N-acetyltransferase